MKKFLALFTVVALLAVAGGAFAADGGTGGHDLPYEPADPGEGSSGAVVVPVTVTEQVSTVALGAADVKGVSEKQATSTPEEQAASSFSSLSSSQITQIFVEVVKAIANVFSNLFGGSSLPVDGVVATADTTYDVQDNSNLKTVASGKTTAEEADAASAYLQMGNHNFAAAVVLPSMSASKSGVYLFVLPEFASKMYGLTFEAFSSVTDKGVEKGKVALLNSKGTQVTKVPDGSDGAVAGFVTLAVYMETGKNYKPVVAVSTTEAQRQGLAAAKDVTVTTSVDAASTATFSTFVPSSLTKGTDYADYVMIPAKAVSRAAWTYADGEKTKLEGTGDYEMLPIASFPKITAPTTKMKYIAAVSFDNGGKTSSDLYGNAASFYPDNVLQATAAAKYFKAGSDGKLKELTTASDILAGGKFAGYIAFELEAAKGATKPVVTVNIKKSTTPGGDTPGGDTPGGDTPGGDIPTPGTNNPGSSGGGCSAGFAAATLAVLAAFIAKRKK